RSLGTCRRHALAFPPIWLPRIRRLEVPVAHDYAGTKRFWDSLLSPRIAFAVVHRVTTTSFY
ncbi:MAG: hypothetical protein ACLP1E_17250, partial [Acidimicrobiales bacterium]